MNAGNRDARIAGWSRPSSDDEVIQQERAVRMVKAAIAASTSLADASLRVYAKGSYANNTNVRRDSDVDIVVQLTECEYFDYYGDQPDVHNPSPYEGPWTKDSWRRAVTRAMVAAFDDVDTSGKIAVKIPAVAGSRPPIDVVPAFDYRLFWNPRRTDWSAGSCVWSSVGKQIVNWPDQQLDNGRAKNDRTRKRYKNTARVLKNAKNHLAAAGTIKDLPSYLMECLAWNVPDPVLWSGSTPAYDFQETLRWLWLHLGDDYRHDDWDEPNQLKYLFGAHQKWTVADAQGLVRATWNLMEY